MINFSNKIKYLLKRSVDTIFRLKILIVKYCRFSSEFYSIKKYLQILTTSKSDFRLPF